MKPVFSKSINSWIIDKTVNGKRRVVKYSINIYGKYAKELTIKSFKDGIRYKNYIEEKKDYAIIKIFSKTSGYHDIFIDKEDIEKIECVKWGMDVDKRDGLNRYVARNYCKGLIHRYILGLNKNDRRIIDHIDRNPLNNRKSNLRICDDRINQQNRNPQKNNTSGVIGVRYNAREKVWIARIADNNGKRICKAYSINKYGDREAKDLAIKWRKEREKEFGYLT